MATSETIIADSEPTPQVSSSSKRLPGMRLVLLSGVLLWLATPSISLWPLAWIGLIPLLLSVTRATRFRQAFWRAYQFAFVFLGVVWYWIWLTVNAFSHSDAGWVAWVLLTLILSCYYGLWGGLAWLLSRRTSGLWRILALSASWVLLEWVRTLGSLVMPWAQLSYSQYHMLPILQIAELTGAYGVTFLIVMVNAALAEWWEGRGSEGEKGRRGAIGFAAICVALAFGYGLIRMAMPDSGRPLTVAAMQGNFTAQEQRSPMQTLQTITDLTRQAAQASPPPSLYVWGESTTKDALHFSPTYLTLQDIALRGHAAVTVGTVIHEPQSQIETNSALLFPPDGGMPVQYDKSQMVPFGEFIPFRPVFGSLMEKQFGFAENDLSFNGHGDVQRYLDPASGKVSLGPFICYESMFPQMARAMTRQGANLLVTQSNDDWFQSDAAMEQHLSAVVLRAIENRRFVARSTTTGVTCLLDSKGRVFLRAPTHTPAYVVGTVQLLEGQTLYVRFGDWFLLFSLGLIAVALRKNRPVKTV